MRILFLLFMLISSLSCRKFVWDNPYDTANPSNEPASLKNGLVAYYPFNGNAKDESGNGNNGTVNGAILVPDRRNQESKAYSFNGTSDYILIGSLFKGIANSNTASYNCWAKKLGNTVGGILISQWLSNATTSGPVGLFYGINSDNYLWGSLIAGVDIFSNQLMSNVEKWNMYTLVYDYNQINPNDRLKVYQNGIRIQIQSTTLSPTIGNQSNLACIGARGVLPSSSYGAIHGFFHGYIDDVRIYNRALTQEEITYLANN